MMATIVVTILFYYDNERNERRNIPLYLYTCGVCLCYGYYCYYYDQRIVYSFYSFNFNSIHFISSHLINDDDADIISIIFRM
jgi:hypothetical protein